MIEIHIIRAQICVHSHIYHSFGFGLRMHFSVSAMDSLLFV